MTSNTEAQQPQGAAPPPVPRYTARLGTRTTAELRRRLRVAAARDGVPIQAFLTAVLDRALPTDAELGIPAGGSGADDQR
jgi:hypothetical protein